MSAPFRRKIDLQSDSTPLRQLELLNGKAADAVQLDVATVLRQASLQGAINLCVSASGLARKQVYGALDIDAATFSRIESGDAHFPPNKVGALMDLCQNEAPLIWLSESRGYDFSSMRKHRNDSERRIAELEQENQDLRRAFRLMQETRR